MKDMTGGAEEQSGKPVSTKRANSSAAAESRRLRRRNSNGSLLSDDFQSLDEDATLNSDLVEGGSVPSTKHFSSSRKRVFCVSAITMTVAILSSGVFMGVGIKHTKRGHAVRFKQQAGRLLQELEESLQNNVDQSLFLHEECRDRNISRTKFREIYDYMMAAETTFHAIECIYNFTDAQRPAAEASAKAFYADKYPLINYTGFTGLEVIGGDGEVAMRPRSDQPFYFPVHLVEPVEGNEAAAGFDLYSTPSRRATIDEALESWKPVISSRLRLVQETDPSAYSVLLLNPGIPLSTRPELKPQDLSLMVLRIPSLLQRALRGPKPCMKLYVYDSSDSAQDPVFLGAAKTSNNDCADPREDDIELLPETSISEIFPQHGHICRQTVQATSKEWTVVVVPADDTYKAQLALIYLGGLLILVASMCLTMQVASSLLRSIHHNRVQSEVETERARLLLDTAKTWAKNEREINHFIAHEVRNPLASALSALSFVSSAVEDDQPLQDKETVKTVREDLSVVSGSLRFVNDLLRSMLDLHRASRHELQICKKETNLLIDVFQPVSLMLYEKEVDIEIDCPPDLVVSTDALRLSQCILNLGRNAIRYSNRGPIRLCAKATENVENVQLSVEDCGPGIPEDQRASLFSKFQRGLEENNQGTGIGMCLAKFLVDLMDGTIWLDDSYVSGLRGFPGCRFAINLNTPPIQVSSDRLPTWVDDNDDYEHSRNSNVDTCSTTASSSDNLCLPSSRYMEKSDHHSGVVQGCNELVGHVSECTETDTPSFREASIGDNLYMGGVETGLPPTGSLGELPDSLSILLVDDDKVLRKLFSRVIKRMRPEWEVDEVCCGEDCLEQVRGSTYDLIFMDQYMSNGGEKRLMGTETVTALRLEGIQSIVCGLSANDVKKAFIRVGADYFVLKPIPSGTDKLENLFLQILSSRKALDSV